MDGGKVIDLFARERLPEQIGGYTIERRIGAGGMAEVFSAVRPGAGGFEKKVCLKLIHAHLARDAEFRDLFAREVRIAGKLHHSNLVQVIDCVEEGRVLALVMELVEGLDLNTLLRGLRDRGVKLQKDLVIHIAERVLDALGYVHVQKVVHRDVSPHNILISAFGEVKLTDFGVAKAIESQVTQTDQFKGKMAYMAPEQARCEPVDYRTDLYSLGLVLYEMVTGSRFHKPRVPSELLGAVINVKRPKLEGVEPALAAVVERLLEPAPADRFQSAIEVAQALPPSKNPVVCAAELAAFIKPILLEKQDAAGTPTQLSAAPDQSAERRTEGTDVLPVTAPQSERVERPVVPSHPSAPTHTRAEPVRDIDNAPTIETGAIEEPIEVRRHASSGARLVVVLVLALAVVAALGLGLFVAFWTPARSAVGGSDRPGAEPAAGRAEEHREAVPAARESRSEPVSHPAPSSVSPATPAPSSTPPAMSEGTSAGIHAPPSPVAATPAPATDESPTASDPRPDAGRPAPTEATPRRNSKSTGFNPFRH